MGLIADLGKGPIGLDSSIFIYYIEEHPDFVGLVAPIFEAIDVGKCSAVTSSLTLLETLVVPSYRVGDALLAERYESLLTRSRGLTLVELGRPILKAAAQLRALFRVRTPDALQLASALSGGCASFLTHGHDLPQVPGMSVLQLGDYAA